MFPRTITFGMFGICTITRAELLYIYISLLLFIYSKGLFMAVLQKVQLPMQTQLQMLMQQMQ